MRSEGRVAELFAGIGGFRLGLEGHPALDLAPTGWRVTWSDQWEPATRGQDASDCYVRRFGPDGHVNEDVAQVLDGVQAGRRELPDIDLVVGGFPCQDYSVARLLNQAAGIQGKKGVLWWEIHRFLELKRPRFVLLENVDRLLRSPANQRGRDLGVMLGCFADLGYRVEWRVVNAADYGFPQRRRRVFIVAQRLDDARDEARGDLRTESRATARAERRAVARDAQRAGSPLELVLRDGVLARALPAELDSGTEVIPLCLLPDDLVALSDTFAYEFQNAGVMQERLVHTFKVRPRYDGPRATLGDVLVDEGDVPREYLIPRAQLKQWRYLKGAKREERTVERNGYRYFYSEGAVAFPDPLDQPSRTILTAEGGSTPSRFKHVVLTPGGGYRRLTPVELERLDGFPDGWTEGMPDRRRAFCLGNALVVGLVQRIAGELAVEAGLETAAAGTPPGSGTPPAAGAPEAAAAGGASL